MNPSPLKGRPVQRPHYKALFGQEREERTRLEQSCAAYREIIAQYQTSAQQMTDDLAYAKIAGFRWAVAALIEAVAIIVILIATLA